MRISLNEIWNFADLLDVDEQGWEFRLLAGDINVDGISTQILQELKNDNNYDTELLPSIFTFREILWQPDVFTEATQSLPPLRILRANAEEIANDYKNREGISLHIYAQLLEGIATYCKVSIDQLESGKTPANKSLGELRIAVFPIIKFFIFHPKNRLDYYRDSLNRLNYAVKIILTEFNGRYTELTEPCWEVTFHKSPKSKISAKKIIEDKEKS